MLNKAPILARPVRHCIKSSSAFAKEGRRTVTGLDGAKHDDDPRLGVPAHLPEVRNGVFDAVVVRLKLARVRRWMHRAHGRDEPGFASGEIDPRRVDEPVVAQLHQAGVEGVEVAVAVLERVLASLWQSKAENFPKCLSRILRCIADKLTDLCVL